MKTNILIVDDDSNVLNALITLLEDDYHPIPVTSGLEALDKIQKTASIELVLLDLTLPDYDGIEILRKIKEYDPNLDVIMISGNTTAETAVKTIKHGAYDYLTKPFDINNLTAVINRALEKRSLSKLTQALSSEIDRLVQYNLVGKSSAMQAIYSLIDKVADADSTVLIQGESGTGKELVARALHKRGTRSSKPLVAVNCAAIPGELVESEFFGHERGAFTSAISRKIGKFEYANGGIIILDDVGELPLPIQAKLLRVLQEKEIVRVGSNDVIPVDVRVLALTNVDLKELVRERRFREDLYYRLKVVPIELPPLRTRREDISLLIEHFVKKSAEKQHKLIKRIESEAMNLLVNYNWPGNVRELENMVETMVLLSSDERLTVSDIPTNVLTDQALNEKTPAEGEMINLKKACHQFEHQFITRVMEKLRWNQTKAAKAMGIHRNTLIIKMERLEINSRR